MAVVHPRDIFKFAAETQLIYAPQSSHHQMSDPQDIHIKIIKEAGELVN